MRVIKITVDGSVSLKDTRSGRYEDMAKAIGCEMVEQVRFKPPFPELKDYVMLVDEEGLCKNPRFVNPVGSVLYGFQNHGHPIMGDILVLHVAMGSEGEEWSEDALEGTMRAFVCLMAMGARLESQGVADALRVMFDVVEYA